MGEHTQTRIVVDGELTAIALDTPIRRRADGLWEPVEQGKLFEPAPEQLPGQTSFPWPEGFDR